MTARFNSPFFRGAWSGTVPLLIWAAHFFGCYALVALGCDQGWPIRWPLLAYSFIIMAGLGWLTVATCRQAQRSPGSTLESVRWLVALLALIGSVWTTVPLWWLPLCHIT